MIYELVKSQHEHFNTLYLGQPRHLTPEEKQFYVNCFLEEVQEYEVSQNLVDEYDGLLDLLVFVTGALLRHGFPIEGIQEVIRANKDKILGPTQKRNDFSLDLQKPPGWKAPNLEKYLEGGIK